jgi:hypothetical protein
MNKAERHRRKMVHYKRRLKNLGIKGEVHCYRSTGKPCSCALCDPHKAENGPKHSTVKRMQEDDGA